MGGTVVAVIHTSLKPLCACGAPAVHVSSYGPPECDGCAGYLRQAVSPPPAPPVRQLGSGNMGLSIDVDDVMAVLLADGWHEVKIDGQNSTFAIAAYTYVRERPGELSDEEVHPRLHDRGDRAPGFCFQETTGAWVGGPLTAVLAVRYRQ